MLAAPEIVITEDDPDDRFILQEAFRELGYQGPVVYLEDGESLVDYLQTRMVHGDNTPSPALILLDLNMPRLSGTDVLKQIKRNPGMSHIPVIMWSTSDLDQDRRRCFQFGADSYLVKPDSMERVKDAVTGLLDFWCRGENKGCETKPPIEEKAIQKVLVVDDCEDDFVLVRDFLEEAPWGTYRCTHVDNFDEAVRMVEAESHDVYLVDYFLGDHSGLEFMRRGLILRPDRPFLIYSGLNDQNLDRRCMSAGAVDFLFKESLDSQYLDKALLHAVRRKNVQIETERLARIDQLTGLLNRAEWYKRLGHELERAARYQEEVTVIMADIDHFKKVNDTYGHPVGDLVLRDLGKLLLEVTRNSDHKGRLGGEEFGLILPHTGRREARKVAEKVRVAFSELGWEHEGRPFQCTLSLGMSVAQPGVSFALDGLIKRADSALYRAKKQGRNQIVCF